MLPKSFLDKGYMVVPADKLVPLLELRAQIFAKCRQIFGYEGADPEVFFNEFHSLNIAGDELNRLRMKLIEECTSQVDSGGLIFDAFENTILSLLGPDLLVQKSTNLVIQQPGDPYPSDLHRDAPGNSAFEIVVWLPLVNAYGSKSMFMVERKTTEKALEMLKTTTDNWDEFEKFSLENSSELDVPFGSALIFWTGVLHGSRINSTQETRWTLNMRYKNLFSPNGKKDAFEFFRVLCISPLAKLGLDFQKRELLP